jgi:hypothetical protein
MRALAVEGEWHRGPASVGDLGELDFGDVDAVEAYDWSVAQQLPYDLAAIRHPADVLGFVRRWGFLHDPDDDEAETPSVEEFERESLRMNWALYRYSLINPVRAGMERRRDMAEYWAGVYSNAVSSTRRWLNDPGRGRKVRPDLLTMLMDTGDFEEMAIDVREGLEEDLWDDLPRVEVSIRSLDFFELDAGEISPPGDFMLTALPRDLLARTYLELALEMTAGISVAACPEDGRIFPIRDPRQIYCSSQCAGRARYRRFANRKKSQQ